VLRGLTLTFALIAFSRCAFAAQQNPFVGEWALTLPGGSPGWLGIEENDGKLSGSILWAAGSVLPVSEVKLDGDVLTVLRQQRDSTGKVTSTETITAKAAGDDLSCTITRAKAGQPESAPASFTGKRSPPLPPAPDLSKVKFGDPITLFNGKDLEGWKLTNPKQANGWSAKDGLLVNELKEQKNYGNLRTEREFEDFNITLETNVAKEGNSGVYLRGIYEIQVFDSYGKKLDPHNMGAVYSRITPTEAAEKPAGEWQTMDITLVDRHVTVILNGKKIIDNQPVLGCTGGALWSDPMKPGPIYLQGDHTGIQYRNIVLKPVIAK
jgi:hypothetical protein